MDLSLLIAGGALLVSVVGLYLKYFLHSNVYAANPTSCLFAEYSDSNKYLLLPISLSNPGTKAQRIDGFTIKLSYPQPEYIQKLRAKSGEEVRPQREKELMWEWFTFSHLSHEASIEIGRSFFLEPKSNVEKVIGFTHRCFNQYVNDTLMDISMYVLVPDDKKVLLFKIRLDVSKDELAEIQSGMPVPCFRTLWWDKDGNFLNRKKQYYFSAMKKTEVNNTRTQPNN